MGKETRPLSLLNVLGVLGTAGIVGCGVTGVDVAQATGGGGASPRGNPATSGGALSTGGSSDGGATGGTPSTGGSSEGGTASGGATDQTGGADPSGTGGSQTSGGASATGGANTNTGGKKGETGGAGGSISAGTGGSMAGSGGQAGQNGALDCSGFFIPPDQVNVTLNYEVTTDAVLDLGTGLMWQRKIDASKKVSLLGITTCTDPTLAGFSDWRLPTVLELATILEFGGQIPTIASPSFPETPADFFATSTGLWSAGKQSSTNKWSVNFATGLTLNGSPEGYVRCVRKAQERVCFSGPRFEAAPKASAANGTATVNDRSTATAWQRDASIDPLTWEQAKEYCGAFNGGRLPNAKELLSIVEWGVNEAIDLTVFPNAAGGDYWTSTVLPGSATEALTVSFGNATYTGTRSAPTTQARLVRCVLKQ